MNLVRQSVIALLLLLAALAAWQLTPRTFLADSRQVKLDGMVPARFGQWQLDPQQEVVALSPELAARLEKVYSQTLTRTYVNPQGDRVMLAVAYGRDQRDGSNSVHYPEICYPAQGFVVGPTQQTRWGGLQVRQLVASMGPRVEPISYWLLVGEHAVAARESQKLVQIGYGLRGAIPDGLLFRVSSVDNDSSRAYAMQQAFVQELFRAMAPTARPALFGKDVAL